LGYEVVSALCDGIGIECCRDVPYNVGMKCGTAGNRIALDRAANGEFPVLLGHNDPDTFI
jgi:hypothetical protein